MPNYRADLYAAGAVFKRIERFDASNVVEAVERARRLLAEPGVVEVKLYATDGQGGTQHIAKVGADR